MNVSQHVLQLLLLPEHEATVGHSQNPVFVGRQQDRPRRLARVNRTDVTGCHAAGQLRVEPR